MGLKNVQVESGRACDVSLQEPCRSYLHQWGLDGWELGRAFKQYACEALGKEFLLGIGSEVTVS